MPDEDASQEEPAAPSALRPHWDRFVAEMGEALSAFGDHGRDELMSLWDMNSNAMTPGMPSGFDISPMPEIKPPDLGDSSPTQESAAPGQGLVEVNQAVFDPQQTIEPPRMEPPAIEGMVIDNPPQRGMDMDI